MEEQFYIVAESALSEAMKKTVQVKELLTTGEVEQIKEAVEQVGISRSAYYRYRDSIFSFTEERKQELITLSLLVVDKAGILSQILTKIAEYKGNILTINQDIPLAEVAHITLTIEVNDLAITITELINKLTTMSGIKKVEIVTQTFKEE
ncbi:ACT domain-containing protein [Halanaerobaculum tunisiense]